MFLLVTVKMRVAACGGPEWVGVQRYEGVVARRGEVGWGAGQADRHFLCQPFSHCPLLGVPVPSHFISVLHALLQPR